MTKRKILIILITVIINFFINQSNAEEISNSTSRVPIKSDKVPEKVSDISQNSVNNPFQDGKDIVLTGHLKDPRVIAGELINTISIFLIIIFICMLLYGVMSMLKNRNNFEKKKRSKRIIFFALASIGVLIGLYIIIKYFFNKIEWV